MVETIKSEVGFGKDNFGKPKQYNIRDSISLLILNILLMKPGNMPSLPYIGVDVKSYLYKNEDEIDPEELKQKIYSQCHEMFIYLVSSDIRIFITSEQGSNILLIYLPIQIDNQNDAILYSFQNDVNGNVEYNYAFESLRK